MATQLLLEACKGSGVKKIVYASSSSVYGDTDDLPMREEGNTRPVSLRRQQTGSGKSLLSVLESVRCANSISALLYSLWAEAKTGHVFSHLHGSALPRRKTPLYDDGEQTRDFTYCSDIVDGLLGAAVYPGAGEIFNLGGGTESSILDVIRMVEEISGRKQS